MQNQKEAQLSRSLGEKSAVKAQAFWLQVQSVALLSFPESQYYPEWEAPPPGRKTSPVTQQRRCWLTGRESSFPFYSLSLSVTSPRQHGFGVNVSLEHIEYLQLSLLQMDWSHA